ncbi:MAG: DMT family transporter [Rhodoferax sp.]|nr:DMT family transporter [Rhodoferax sp.]
MVVVTLMWSTAGVVSRHLESARSFEVTFWRALFTALSLVFLLPLVRGRRVFSDIRHAGVTFWVSGVCWSVMFTAFMVALTLTSVANVLVTMSLGPLFTALVARVFIGHRIAFRTWIAIGAAGLGIAIMYGSQVSGSQFLGILVALCVPIAGATNWTITQNSHSQGQDIDLVPAVFVGAVISSLATLPFATPFQATAHDLGLLAALGVGQLAVPCVLSVLCAKVLKAPEIALLALLEVIFGILLAWLGAGERPGAEVLTGGTLVIGALLVNEILGWKNRNNAT